MFTVCASAGAAASVAITSAHGRTDAALDSLGFGRKQRIVTPHDCLQTHTINPARGRFAAARKEEPMTDERLGCGARVWPVRSADTTPASSSLMFAAGRMAGLSRVDAGTEGW
jgi:hypothetical protein